MLDSLLFNQKMVFVQYLYANDVFEPISKKAEMRKMEVVVKEYFDRCIMRTARKTGVLFNKDNSWIIYVQSKEDPSVWSDGLPQDTNIFSAEIVNKIVPVKKLADRVAFISMFKDQGMKLFVKDMTNTRTTGARVDSAGKVKIIELINHIQGNPIYTHENTKTISQIGLCIVLEFLMRYKTEHAAGERVWYLLPEQAAIIKIKEI